MPICPQDPFGNSSTEVDDSNHSIAKTPTMVWIQDEQNLAFGWQVSKAFLLEQAQGRESHCMASYWLPRASYKKMPPKSQKAKTPRHPHCKLKSNHKAQTFKTQRWIPKTTLISQGYYEGAQTLWLPKQTQSKSPFERTTTPHSRPTSSPFQWRPKVQAPIQPSVEA